MNACILESNEREKNTWSNDTVAIVNSEQIWMWVSDELHKINDFERGIWCVCILHIVYADFIV